jgi:S1-C subfamily serine protease
MTTGLFSRRTPVCELLLLLTLVAAPCTASGTSVAVGKPTGNGTKSSGGGAGAGAAPKTAASLPKTFANDPAERVFRDARSYTVRIHTQITSPFVEDQRGSFEGAGFVVDEARGWVLTNAHVVGHSPSQISVAFADRPFRPAKKVYVDPYSDIALIEVDPLDRGRGEARMSCDPAPSVGEPVGAFGHPLGMPFTGTRGIVSGVTDKFGPDLIQIDATVDHGNSGGPVIRLSDEVVVGIATAMAGNSKEDKLNFATPVGDACRIVELLKEGKSPSPPQLPVAFLEDEDDRLTLQVQSSYDSKRWPLVEGDRIISVQGGDSLGTLSELVTALRGETGKVALVVDRQGKREIVSVMPQAAEPVVERRGVDIDGALIGPVSYEDAKALKEPASIIVQSVEPGSTAEMAGIEQQDILRSVDRKQFEDFDHLVAYLKARTSNAPLSMVFCRWSGEDSRIFDYLIRQLPGDDMRLVGPEGKSKESAAASR